eukprot:15365905-Ditylum_brightwellii.AAC.2
MEKSYFIQLKDELFGKDWFHSYTTETLNAKYDFTDVIDVVNRQNHLTQSQKDALLTLLHKHQHIFDGTLGKDPHKKFHIDVNPDAKSVYSRPYSILRIHFNTF